MPDDPAGRVGPATRLLFAALSLVVTITLSSPSIAAATVSTQPDEAAGTSVPAPSEVDTTDVVDTTPVETAPDESRPADTVATTAGPDSGLVGADPDPDAGDVALLAIVGLVLVLSLAAWWMARRDDERPVPDPPPPPGDLI